MRSQSLLVAGPGSEPAAQGLLRFCLGPVVASLAGSLLGADAAFLTYQVAYKPAGVEKIVPWHQDDKAARTDPGYLTLWIALSEIHEFSGCLRFLPGISLDKLREVQHERRYPTCWSWNHPEQGVPIALRSGDLVVFQSKLIHMSGPNRSRGMRKALSILISRRGLTRQGQVVPTILYRAE
jgi:ectoine hydroxylase-related dioxygenase (phytanoyl-CoA dioxygenase family)